MIQFFRTLPAVLLVFAGITMGQDQTDAYGDVQTGQPEAVGAGTATGQLLVDPTTTGVIADQVDVVVVGPDGIRFTNRITVEQAQPYENLPSGVYAVMGTGANLGMVTGITEVMADTRTTVTMVLEPYVYRDDFRFDYGVYDPYPGYRVAYDPVVGYDPYAYGPRTAGFVDWGSLQVLLGVEDENDDVNDARLSVVGPDGLDLATRGEAFLDQVPAGVYSVAATMDGYAMQQALVWVRPGEIASVTLPLVTLPATE